MTTFHCTINGETKSCKLEGKIIDAFYFADTTGKKLKTVQFGEKVNLIVKSKGMIGEKVSFLLTEKTVNFAHLNEEKYYRGKAKKLENDIIADYTIEQDVEKIPLEIIPGTMEYYKRDGINTFELIHKDEAVRKASLKVKLPIGPYFLHGTWGTDASWYDHDELIPDIIDIFGHSPNSREVLFNWSGFNLPAYRILAADCLIDWVKRDREENGMSRNIPITIVGHSHGGSIAILALNRGLIEFAIGNELKINLVTLNTPVVRTDNTAVTKTDNPNITPDDDTDVNFYGSSINQLTDNAWNITNHYHVYTKDMVQHRGGASKTKEDKNPEKVEMNEGGGLFNME